MADKDIFDDVGPVEMYAEMLDEFGTRTAVEMVGWCVLIGAVVREGEGQPELVERLKRLGISKSAVYRAIANLKQLKARIEKKRGRPMSVSEVIQQVASASPSLLGESVV
jgi:hypothetical protein